VLRFALFYGPDAQATQDLVKFVENGLAPVPGRPDAFISSLTHDDAAAAVVAALTVPAGIYNVVDDRPVTHREFVDSLADTLGVRHPMLLPAWIAPLLGQVGTMLTRSLRISNRKLRGAAPWKPRYSSVVEGWPSVIEAKRGQGSATR